MATYDSYKDSGVKWLGQIPSHWEILPGKAIFNENKTKNTNNLENFVLSLSYGNIIPKRDINEGLVPENYSGYQIVEPGYIIIRCTDLQNDKVSLRTGHVNHQGIISGAYLGLKPKNGINSHFMHYLLHNWDVSKELYRYGSGLRQSLSWSDIKYLLLAMPPIKEQEAIVAYLNNVTAEIDRAIEAQQKMIDALNERKQIIITRAVTRGLNPDAPLRYTGIDWLGPIPSHWDFCKLKYFIRIKSGDSISNTQLSDNGKYLVYGGGEPLGRYNQYNINKGNIVIGRVGARCGCITPIYEKAWATDNALVVSCEGIDYQYLIYCLIAADLNKIASSNAQPLLTGTKVKNTYIAIPNLAEQKEIVSHVGKATKSLYLSIANCERMISLLQERKQIIINEVVTGKKKVI